MEGLEDDADAGAAHERQLVLIERHEFVTGNLHLAGSGALEAGNDHQQRGLAGSAGADNGNGFPRRNSEIDAFQDLDRARTAGKGQRHLVKGNDGFGHDSPRFLPGLAPSSASFYFSIKL